MGGTNLPHPFAKLSLVSLCRPPLGMGGTAWITFRFFPGSAAGFVAMFSAPLAGIMFAIEEMGRTLEERISGLVLTAIIFAGFTAYALLRSYIYFEDESNIMPLGQSWLTLPWALVINKPRPYYRVCNLWSRLIRSLK